MRAIAWFSCGVSSAIAAEEALKKYGSDAVVAYCNTMSTEHPDNARFMADVEAWLGVQVVRIQSEKYASVDQVFVERRYMAGTAGALCTVEMKKLPRFAFQRADDIHIFGFTAEEGPRIERLTATNPELHLDWILRDLGLRKSDCLERIQAAGIALPAMYRLGYDHNNCLGCVKATSPAYWNRIRHDFPDVFQRRVEQSRAIGARLVRIQGRRAFLDELQPQHQESFLENLSCGPECADHRSE